MMSPVRGRVATFTVFLLAGVGSAFRQSLPAEIVKDFTKSHDHDHAHSEPAVDPKKAELEAVPSSEHQQQHEEQQASLGATLLAASAGSFARGPGKVSLPTSASSASLLATQHTLTSHVRAGTDFLTALFTEPDFMLLVAFLVVGLWGTIRVWLQHSSDKADASAKVRAQRDELQTTYLNNCAEIEGILSGMSESSACLAEWNFEEKRQKFQKFVERVRDKPDNFIDSREVAVAIVDPFRTFLTLWLSIYQQCTLDPMNKPKVIVPEKDLRKCRNLVDMAGLVADRLSKNSVSFIKAWVTKVRKQDRSLDPNDLKEESWIAFGKCGFGIHRGSRAPQQKAEVDGESEYSDNEEAAQSSTPASRYPIDVRMGLVRMMVLSQTHGIVLVAFGMGLLAITVQLLLDHISTAVVAAAAEAGLAFILYNIEDLEELAALQIEINKLQVLSEEVRNNHDQLNVFYGKMTKLSHLWRYRTLPCLEHFDELHLALLSMQGADKVAFLQALNDTWTPKLEGLGDVEDWMGENSISEDFLKLASTQLNQATEYVVRHRGDEMASSLVLQRVEQTFGFLVIRVLAAFNLKNKGPMGQTSNPYVVLSVNQRGGKAMFKTNAVTCDLNPRFGQEFFIPIQYSANILELHVKDDQKNGEENVSLGFHNVMFREMHPGDWIKRKEFLWSERKQTQQKSELVYEVFFADELRQLRDLQAP